MKNILLLSLLLISTMSFPKTPPTKSVLFLKNENTKINLRLNLSPKVYNEPNWKVSGACLLLSGVAFATASILEGGSQYGTYRPGSTPNTQTYYQPPFHQQQPRFAMFVIGCGFTIGGFGMMISN